MSILDVTFLTIQNDEKLSLLAFISDSDSDTAVGNQFESYYGKRREYERIRA